jgi:hypothetical protein
MARKKVKKFELVESFQIDAVPPCIEGCNKFVCIVCRAVSFIVIPVRGTYEKTLITEKIEDNSLVREYQVILSPDFEGIIYDVKIFSCKKDIYIEEREDFYVRLEEEKILLNEAKTMLKNRNKILKSKKTKCLKEI